MTARLATLEEIEAAVWHELTCAAKDKAHAWRTQVLATVDAQGSEPRADARIVVLREAEPLAKTLLIYSDARAGKARQLQAHPLGTLVAWSQSLGWQIRCSVGLTLEDEGLSVSSRWASIKTSPGAYDYLSPLPPGAPLDSAAPASRRREHFAVITAAVTHIDWLELGPGGQRRASFSADGRRWLQP